MAALLLMVAGLQTADAQGFRVYMSDGTLLQFSMKTDSIVFDNGLSGDEVFGPFTPVNQCIAKTWYKSKSESVTFGADGTTDYIEGGTYKFFPYQGNIIVYNASGAPVNILRVYEVTGEKMIVGTAGESQFKVWATTVQPQLVEEIVLSETSINLEQDNVKSLTATVLPEDADNKDVTWESSDDNVAEVNARGRVTANGEGTCTNTCRATDGSGVFAECQVRVTNDNSGVSDGREYVDLCLPSGTLWATCNVGANSPEEYGDYFAWGETEPKGTYNWSTYKWCNGSNDTMTKYCTDSSYGYNGFTDGKTELDPEDDAATANWGSGWQMPSLEQMEELYNSSNTTTEWTQQNDVNGYKITSNSNGNSIFLPAKGGSSSYWSRSLNADYSNSAYYLGIYSRGIETYDNAFRCNKNSVRPVRVN